MEPCTMRWDGGFVFGGRRHDGVVTQHLPRRKAAMEGWFREGKGSRCCNERKGLIHRYATSYTGRS
jgi:hypothetical protein